MISKARIKYLTALQQKKHRQKERLFVAEGHKIIGELLLQNKFEVEHLYASKNWSETNAPIYNKNYSKTTLIGPNELKKISNLKNPQEVLAVVKMPKADAIYRHDHDIALALENIQDPGNMGTIIRIADWFGISKIFCSETCVDVYNPKVIQASMGSFLRVDVLYHPLHKIFELNKDIPVYGALLGGENAFRAQLKKPSFLLIGNEGKGLSVDIQHYVSHRLTIPKSGGAESLNAGVATGILCALFRQ